MLIPACAMSLHVGEDEIFLGPKHSIYSLLFQDRKKRRIGNIICCWWCYCLLIRYKMLRCLKLLNITKTRIIHFKELMSMRIIEYHLIKYNKAKRVVALVVVLFMTILTSASIWNITLGQSIKRHQKLMFICLIKYIYLHQQLISGRVCLSRDIKSLTPIS